MTREQYQQLLAEPETYAKLCNGLGPNKYREILRKFLPDGLMQPAADRHDVAFLSGGSNALRRFEDAALFYGALAWKKKNKKTDPKYTYLAVAIRAILFFKSHEYWNYRAFPIEWDRLLEIARESTDDEDCKRRCFAEPV